MLTGHTSHQVGLDADIWLTPMPDRKLSREEREFMSATMMVRDDRLDVDPNVWTRAHTELIRIAAEDPAVERIFVNAAIKKALCREAGSDRAWLAKVRPWYGHDYHFHVRIFCPPDSPQCEAQPPPDMSEGCGHALDSWFTEANLHPHVLQRAAEAGAGADDGEVAAGLPPSSDSPVATAPQLLATRTVPLTP